MPLKVFGLMSLTEMNGKGSSLKNGCVFSIVEVPSVSQNADYQTLLLLRSGGTITALISH